MSPFTDQTQPYGPGHLSPRGALKDPRLAARLRGYKVALTHRMKVVKPDDIERAITPGALLVSPKIDGELWFFVRRGEDCALCAFDGRVMEGTPLIDALRDQLQPFPGDLILAGELCAVAGRQRPRVHDLLEALGNHTLEDALRFEAIDILEEGDEEWHRIPWGERHERLGVLLGACPRSGAVQIERVGDPSAVKGRYHEWVATGRAEGLVVRDEYDITYKIKPELTLDAVIVAFGAQHQKGLRTVSEFVLALRRDEHHLQILGSVSKGLKDAERATWHERLTRIVVPSSHMVASRGGTLCHFVKPEVVCEIDIADIEITNSRGAALPTQVLTYSPELGYAGVCEMPLAKIKDPVFVRERPDKLPDLINIGLEQIFMIAPFEGRRSTPTSLTLPEATLWRRGVWTRVSGERTLIRKYVAVKTNKADLDPDYPAYAIHFTDFSPDRADPLKTQVRSAGSAEHAAVLIEAWVDKNIKRGWTPV